MEVPYFDLKAQYAGLREDILAALDRVCRTASFVLGEEVARFEEEFAAYCEVRHCVALNSGTSALHLALLAAGVQPGDEVITTPNTFIGTAEAISYVGARPVFVDIHPATANLDPARPLRPHGQTRRDFHDRVGYNYRMDGFQGAVLRVKLRRLEAWTARRQEIARLYRARLAGARVDLPADDANAESVYPLFVVYVDGRDRIREALAARGVGTAIHYPRPIHLQAAYACLGHAPGSFPHAERACERVLSMPLFPEMTIEQAEYAAQALAEIVGAR